MTAAARVRSRPSNLWPRAVTVCLGAAIVYHSFAAVQSIGTGDRFGPADWTALALAELALLLVALHAPAMFQFRTQRLVGVAVAANAVVILLPLPAVVGRFGQQVPRLMIISIAGGVLVMAAVFLMMSPWAVAPCTRHPQRRAPSERAFPVAIIAITLLVLPVWFAAAGAPPLLSLFSTSTGELALDRQAALSRLDLPALRFVLGMLRNLLIMFAAGWFVADAVTTSRNQWRRRSSSEIAALTVVGLGAVFAVLTTERAILGELLVVCAVAYLVARRRQLSMSVVGTLVAAAVVFPIAVGLLSGAGGPLAVLKGLQRRVMYVPTEVMTRYFVEFPLFHDFLGGSSVPKLSYLTGGETFDLSGHIYMRYYQRSAEAAGNANGSFFGVGWANFGPWGVLLWAGLAAVALVLLDKWIDRLPIRSSAALRGLGIVVAVLTTSSDVFRSVLGFAPGFIDLLLVVGAVSSVERRRTVYRPRAGQPLPSPTGGRVPGAFQVGPSPK